MKCVNKLVSMIISICLLGIASNLSAAVVAYWDFSSDTNGVTDVSGNYHTLVNNGVVISNGVAVFDGTHSTFSTMTTLDLSQYTRLTVECFVKTKTSSSSGMLLEHSPNVGSYPGGFFLNIPESTPGKIDGTIKTASFWHVDSSPGGTVNDGQWHHVAWVYDNSDTTTNRYVLFIDGIQQPQNLSLASTAATSLQNQTLYIGSRGNSEFKLTGELDDVRISSTALTTNEFLQTRTGPLPVIAQWSFDEGAGMEDSSGNGNTLTGSGVTFTNGVALFNGSHTFNTASTLNLSAYSSVTAEFFMRTTATPTMQLIEHTTQFYSAPGAFIVDVNEGGAGSGKTMGGFCTATGTKLNLDITGANATSDGQWHHVAIVLNSAISGSNRSRLYLDGVAQPVYLSWTDGTLPALRNSILYIGSRNNSTAKYIGEMDDIRITGKALNPSQFLKNPSTDIPEVIAYWPFSNSSPLADDSGNDHDLSNTGVTFKDSAAVFDGTHTAFSTQPSTLNLHSYSALTVEYFIRTTSTNLAIVLEQTSNFTVYRGGFISTLNEIDVGQIQSGFSLSGGNFAIDITDENAVNDGNWHHVAITYDPDSNGLERVRFYLDHVQQASREPYVVSRDDDISFQNGALFIGSRANSDNKFTGELDDIKITGAVLSPDEFMTKRSYNGATILMLQ